MKDFVRRGEQVPGAKMTEAKVREARKLFEKGLSVKDIAKRFGVHITTMSMIIRRKRWSHVQ